MSPASSEPAPERSAGMRPRPPFRPAPRLPSPVGPTPGRCDPRSRRESAVVLTVLGLLAVLAVVLRIPRAHGASWPSPVLLSIASALAAALLARHARRLDARSRRPWQALAVGAALLSVAELVHVLDPAAGQGAWAQLPHVVAVPFAIAAGLALLPPRSGRRPGVPELLDAVIVLLGVLLVAGLVLSDALGRSRGTGGALLVVGYPVIGGLLCGLALLAVCRVDRSRRRAAVWLLVTMVALVVVAVAGALADVLGEGAAGVLGFVAWTAMLAAAVRAVDEDPGAPVLSSEEPSGPALFGVVVSQATAYGVVGVVLVVLGQGRTLSPVQLALTGLVVLLTALRSFTWAADGGRLTRRLAQTEAYFRALAASAEDVTVVLDESGTVVWLSGAVRGQLGWTASDLTGRRLADLVDTADREILARAVAEVGVSSGLAPTVRLRTRDGDWRDVELAGAARRGGVAGTVLRDGLVLHLRDVTARRVNQRELERLAYTDYLTGLPNRARFMAALDAARARAGQGEPSSVLLIDLDGFKAVNDVAGHDAGDQLLVQVADQLRRGARAQDLVARLGGDEFALLVPGGPDEATGLAERLVVALDRSYRAPSPGDHGAGPVFTVSGSIGVAGLDGAADVSDTVRQADLALRAAKAAGKGCVRSSGEALDAAIGRRTRLARDLPAAIRDGHLRVHYQPVVGVHDRRVLGLEALVRWEHPLLGTVPPDEFIHLAEEDGLIVPLQRWVLQVATRQAAVLLADGWDIQMGVNVSVRHLQAGCLAPDVAAALAAAQLPPGKLILELTESVLLDASELLTDLEALRGMGVFLSLDDFGRGWSSLAYLARLPVRILKMDREFVAGIENGPRGRALVAGVVELGRSLGMDVVAEGVETEGQVAHLRAMDCQYMQGYLFGRPMPFADLRALLDSFDPAVLDGDQDDLDADVHMVRRLG